MTQTDSSTIHACLFTGRVQCACDMSKLVSEQTIPADYDRILRAHLILSEGVILHLWDSCIHGCEFEETSTPEGFHTSVKLLITGFFRTLLAYARTELCLTSHMRHL